MNLTEEAISAHRAQDEIDLGKARDIIEETSLAVLLQLQQDLAEEITKRKKPFTLSSHPLINQVFDDFARIHKTDDAA